MDRLITFCIKYRFLVIFGVLLAGVVGVRLARQLPVDAVPDVTNVQVQVLSNAPSLGPLEVEQYITVPIETSMSGLPGVEEVRSLSRVGLSAVTVVFEEGTDIYFARQLVSERLGAASDAIPSGYGEVEMGPVSSGLGEIYQFEVRGEPMCEKGAPDTPECYTPMELRTILDWYVSYQLRPLPGVVEVSAFGGELKTYEVQLDPEHLSVLGLSARDVMEALEKNNANAGGGYIASAGEQYIIRGESLLDGLDEIRQVRIATRDGSTPILVGDVATVVEAPRIRQGAVTRDGRGEAVTGIVMMLIGANSGEVADSVRERLDELAIGLPKGVTIETFYDRSQLVDRTVQTVVINLIEGGVLVIVVLLLMLGNLRGGLLVASVIPLAMVMTLVGMYALGVSGNLMSLGALDFGLIIDGAIVVIENVTRRLSLSGARTPRQVQRETRSAVSQVVRPVVFGTAIIMIVYVPILMLEGVEGKMFKPMAIAVLLALGAALALSLTFVPAMASWMYQRGGVSEKEPFLLRIAQRAYAPVLDVALAHRSVVIMAALLSLMAGGWLVTRMGAEFIPTLDEGAIAIQAVRPPSVSLEESLAATQRVERTLLEAFPDEVETVISKTGRPEVATDPMGVEISDIYVMLHPEEGWTRARDKKELVSMIEARLELEVPGQNYSFSQPIELRTNELISGVRSDVAINLYGSDLEELGKVGQAVIGALGDLPGAADLNMEQVGGVPTMRVAINRRQAARYGLDASDILDVVRALGGHPVGVIFEEQRRFDLQVRWSPDVRRSVEQVRALLVGTPDGGSVPLGQVAHIEFEDGPSVISRENAQRRVTVQVNVRDRDLATFVQEARARLEERGVIPPGYFVSWGGQFENLEAATGRLSVAVPVALAMIFMLLYLMFGSWRPALIIYLNVPIAAVGGVVALWLRGMPLSISAGVGFIALSGIAVLNGVVMISYIRELQQEDGLELMEATRKGASLRLRAVLMTALTDGLGFLPMAISTTAGGEVQRPLATVVLGGLCTATLLTLCVLPAMYSLFGEREPEDEEGEQGDGAAAI